ncbi:MAG TPA: hypothetical protein VG778_03800, partial [Blastocatellia bacterium]|nr:hypothetical protein [Blastocatellia bacterium]
MAKADTSTKKTTKAAGTKSKPASSAKKPTDSKPASTASSKAAPEPKPAAARRAETGPVVLDGVALPATQGKAGIFGGPKDRGIKPDDKLALPTGRFFVYERVHSLNPKSFYCAMRWDYHLEHKSPEEGKRWWANKKLLVTNPNSGKAVVVRAVDRGPHENTGLDISLS